MLVAWSSKLGIINVIVEGDEYIITQVLIEHIVLILGEGSTCGSYYLQAYSPHFLNAFYESAVRCVVWMFDDTLVKN